MFFVDLFDLKYKKYIRYIIYIMVKGVNNKNIVLNIISLYDNIIFLCKNVETHQIMIPVYGCQKPKNSKLGTRQFDILTRRK